MDSMTIGSVAKLANVGVETIRFYERQGLIERPRQSAAGYRQYSPEVVQRIQFIRRAKELGFSLKEIKELLTLRIARGANCAQVKGRAAAKIEDVEAKIRSLQRMKQSLRRLITACESERSVSECPILDALEENKKRDR